jgi:hypothetical protein
LRSETVPTAPATAPIAAMKNRTSAMNARDATRLVPS